MESYDFKIMRDEIASLNEPNKLRSEWLWLESKGAGSLFKDEDGNERFAVNPDTFMIYAKKLKEYNFYLGRIAYAREQATKNEKTI